MPFSPKPAATARARALDAALQDNARVHAIGVSEYDHFPGAPVPSATTNALAWVLQALRMGINPVGNNLNVEEADDPVALRDELVDLLEVSSLSDNERTGIQQLIAGIGHSSVANWQIARPTLASILYGLVFVGNHLEFTQRCRLLLTFSGHGAVSEGRLVLCAADTVPDPGPTIAPEQEERLRALLEVLDSRGQGGEWAEAQQLLVAGFRQARQRNIASEFLDVATAPVETMGVRFAPFAIVALLRNLAQNVRRIPAQPDRPAPAFGNVLTPFHLMMCLGKHDARVTVVLDTCHSGGPSSTLQGTMSAHSWLGLGLRARLLSASMAGQQAAEARIGTRRFSAATWAMTSVLSRWSPVHDGDAYALNIRNGDLVHRANQLLHSLGFTQQVSLHAPSSAKWPAASDMPFFGLRQNTPTHADPQEDSDGIQLSSGSNEITGWSITQNGANRALLLAVGGNDWHHPPQGAPGSKTYSAGKLYVFSTAQDTNALADQPFDVQMFTANSDIGAVVDHFNNQSSAAVLAVNDPGEQPYQGPQNPPNVFQFHKGGAPKTVLLRWFRPGPGNIGKLQFLCTGAFPYTPADFDAQGQMHFSPSPTPGLASGSWEHTIVLK